MTLRDRAEAALRAWNRYEIGRGAPPVVDFDCYPEGAGDVQAASSRVAVRTELAALQSEARGSGAVEIDERLGASIAYLDALLGARLPLDEYVRVTQGCDARGWSDEYLESVRSVAVGELERLGVPWNAETGNALKAVEGPIADADAAAVIQKYARDMEDDVRRLADTDAPFTVTVEHVDLDVYWAYWLDGAGSEVRLRINSRNASFTEVQARQFALHELLGHGLQCASYAQQCRQGDVPWVRMTSVHAQQQVLLEGLAQALPLFVRPTDQLLVARVRLAHYTELAKAKVYLAINNGTGVPECVDLARSLVPFWSEAAIGDMLTDRSVDPLLRSYLWAYPAGIDWFVRLADTAPLETSARVIRESYRAPLTPSALTQFWPGSPSFGGDRN
ncbi:hypothetical protein [Pseudonocardia thermophila]|uniref:hypothetical protein n=1 Tax=Pseudonocardia thermophila TaxID=1848 RepID=UPI00248E8A22|nr:hypothetical protein [Pseudonocardia thermophila]